MRAGLLNRQITILKPITTTSEYGGIQTDWKDFKTTKARVIFNSGDRLLEHSEIYHSYMVSFVIRNYHSITEEMRIRYREKQYRIIAIEEQNQSLILKCETVNE